MITGIRSYLFGSSVDQCHIDLAMQPARRALELAVSAGGRLRYMAQEAVNHAISQLQETQALQGQAPDTELLRVKLNLELRQLNVVKNDVSTVTIESSADAHELAARVSARLASATDLITTGRFELAMRAQDLLISVREFDGHIKALPKKIHLAAYGRPEEKPSSGIWTQANHLMSVAILASTRILGASNKKLDFTSLADLRLYAKKMENVVRRRLSLRPKRPTMHHHTTSSIGTEHTYGAALSNFRCHLGPASMTCLREILKDLVPKKNHALLAPLDPFLDKLAHIIATSKHSNLDLILDDEKDTEAAETIRGILTLVEIFTRLEPIDETAAPGLQIKLRTMINTEFASELSLVRALPDNVDTYSLRRTRGAPIAGMMISDLAKKIIKTRALRQNTSRLNEDAPAFDKFLIEILPTVRRYLASMVLRKLVLTTATSRPGRFILNRISRPILRLVGKNLSKEERDDIICALPIVLRIIQALDLTSRGRRDNIQKVVRFMDVLIEGVHGKQPFNTKDFTIKALEATKDLADMLICDTTFVGIKAVAHLPIRQTP